MIPPTSASSEATPHTPKSKMVSKMLTTKIQRKIKAVTYDNNDNW